jgi:plasmid stabilization system protein ParE
LEEVRLVRIRHTIEPRHDLGNIYNYIEERDPQAASRVIARIRAAVDLLSEFPRIGHAGRAPDTREWVVKGLPYIIVHELRDDELIILAIFHGAPGSGSRAMTTELI